VAKSIVQGVGPDFDAVDLAINRVLAAERSAREVLEQRRREAARILNEAEQRAAAIGRRAEARMRAAHRIADLAVEQAQRELRATSPGRDASPSEAQAPERIDRAVDRLIAEILGGGG
jgi:cell division septum initiation protein DivIVA